MSDLPTIPRTKYIAYEPVFLQSRRDEMPASAWLFLWVGKRQDRRSVATFQGRDRRDVGAQMARWIRLVKAKALSRKQADRLLAAYNGRLWR